jgi:hypothetical protein
MIGSLGQFVHKTSYKEKHSKMASDDLVTGFGMRNIRRNIAISKCLQEFIPVFLVVNSAANMS